MSRAMDSAIFADELARYGPNRSRGERITRAAAEAYCRRLAIRHDENFTVASWLLPRRLRPHFYHLYAYCRWADDLADETGNAQASLDLLDWWEAQLRGCYQGESEHPVFIALESTIREFEIPAEPFLDLLAAFRRDQRQTRYETLGELLDYCRCSANPVGHLILYLGRCYDAPRAELADSICTGLQLANFWQDIARDWDAGRIYLPREISQQFGYQEVDFQQRACSPQFREMLAGEVTRAEQMLEAGFALVPRLPRELRIDVELFIRGGLAILAAIRRVDYDVWRRRPVVGKAAKLRLLAGAWWRHRFGRRQGVQA